MWFLYLNKVQIPCESEVGNVSNSRGYTDSVQIPRMFIVE